MPIFNKLPPLTSLAGDNFAIKSFDCCFFAKREELIPKVSGKLAQWSSAVLIPAQIDRPINNQILVDLYTIDVTQIIHLYGALACTVTLTWGILVCCDKQPLSVIA